MFDWKISRCRIELRALRSLIGRSHDVELNCKPWCFFMWVVRCQIELRALKCFIGNREMSIGFESLEDFNRQIVWCKFELRADRSPLV